MLVPFDSLATTQYGAFMKANEPEMYERYGRKCNTKNVLQIVEHVIPDINGEIPTCIVDRTEFKELEGKLFGLTTHGEDKLPKVVMFIGRNVTDEQIRALKSHEYKHAQQILEGRLVLECASSQVIWEGKKYRSRSIEQWTPIDEIGLMAQRLEYMAYCAQPWEFEANEGFWNVIAPEFGDRYTKVCNHVKDLSTEEIIALAEEIHAQNA